MLKRLLVLSTLFIFSSAVAAENLEKKEFHSNYKTITFDQKIEQMESLGLSKATSFTEPNVKAFEKGFMIKSQLLNAKRKADFIGKEPMIPSNGRDECEDGYIEDCSGDGDCCPESWIGDGFLDCEDPNNYGCDLTCYDNDGGDCAEEGDGGDDGDDNADDGGTGGDDGGGSSCTESGGNETWLGDGWCDAINNNEACGYDSGDCCYSTCVSAAYDCDAESGPCTADICIDPEGNNDGCEDPGDDGGTDGDDGGSEECGEGEVEDCSGDGDCCPEPWIGDGIPDCEDQFYGCDLSCYENDGGDCSDSADDGGDDGEESECSNYSQEDCMWLDYCMWTDAGCVDYDGSQCENYDCMDQCYDGYEGWIGDGFCDDGSWGLYFNCEEFDCDGGDCLDENGECSGDSGDDGGDDGGNEECEDGYIEDCSGDGDCCPEGWIGDGYADCEDQSYGCDLSCYENDGGDCGDSGDDGGDFECSDLGYEDCMYYDSCEWISSDNSPEGGECVDAGAGDDGGDEGCDDSQVEDCSGDGDCCPASWIGDGYGDCEDQAWGCDLSCYENDGGDCEESSDDGGDDEVQVALILGDGMAIPGGDTQISLSLESIQPVAGVQFTLSSSPGGMASVYDLSFILSDDCFEADFSNTADGQTIGLIYSLSGCLIEPSDESVEIATLSLEVSPNAEWGSAIELYFEETIVAGDGGVELNSSSYGGVITIGMVGDVNHDGNVDVIDAVSMINFILQVEEPIESQIWAADINEDGTLNILDVVLLVDMILGD